MSNPQDEEVVPQDPLVGYSVTLVKGGTWGPLSVDHGISRRVYTVNGKSQIIAGMGDPKEGHISWVSPSPSGSAAPITAPAAAWLDTSGLPKAASFSQAHTGTQAPPAAIDPPSGGVTPAVPRAIIPPPVSPPPADFLTGDSRGTQTVNGNTIELIFVENNGSPIGSITKTTDRSGDVNLSYKAVAAMPTIDYQKQMDNLKKYASDNKLGAASSASPGSPSPVTGPPALDTDGDGTPNARDKDDDRDGIPDTKDRHPLVEGTRATDEIGFKPAEVESKDQVTVTGSASEKGLGGMVPLKAYTENIDFHGPGATSHYFYDPKDNAYYKSTISADGLFLDKKVIDNPKNLPKELYDRFGNNGGAVVVAPPPEDDGAGGGEDKGSTYKLVKTDQRVDIPDKISGQMQVDMPASSSLGLNDYNNWEQYQHGAGGGNTSVTPPKPTYSLTSDEQAKGNAVNEFYGTGENTPAPRSLSRAAGSLTEDEQAKGEAVNSFYHTGGNTSVTPPKPTYSLTSDEQAKGNAVNEFYGTGSPSDNSGAVAAQSYNAYTQDLSSEEQAARNAVTEYQDKDVTTPGLSDNVDTSQPPLGFGGFDPNSIANNPNTHGGNLAD